MALPVFRNAGAKAAGTTAQTPALPASMVANDICILVATTITAGSITLTADGSVTPWTALTGSPMDAGGGQKLYVWWGRFSSGSTGPTVTPGSGHITAGVAAWSGVITNSTLINKSVIDKETTSDTSFSFATGISTTEADCLCICVCSILADTNTAQFTIMTNSNLSNLAERMDYCTNSGVGGGFSLCEGGLVKAGAIGTWASTLSTASPKDYISFALRSVDTYTWVPILDKGIIQPTPIFHFPQIVSV